MRPDINKIMFYSTQTVLDEGYCKTTCRVYAAWFTQTQYICQVTKKCNRKIEAVSNTRLLNSIDALTSLSYIAHTSTPLTSRRCDDAVLVIVKKLDTSQISAILFDSTIHLLPTTEKQLYLIYDADICYRQIC